MDQSIGRIVRMSKSLANLIVVGDKLLIKPLRQEDKTDAGLFLPPNVKDKEKVQQGYVVKLGPGYILPTMGEDEVWKAENPIKYIPLQAREGDLAIFLLGEAVEIIYKKEKYFVVSQSSVLLLEREP